MKFIVMPAKDNTDIKDGKVFTDGKEAMQYMEAKVTETQEPHELFAGGFMFFPKKEDHPSAGKIQVFVDQLDQQVKKDELANMQEIDQLMHRLIHGDDKGTPEKEIQKE